MEVSAKITGIEYTPLLCRPLNQYDISELEDALKKDSSFILNVQNNRLALSWWVSPKRTRSYPYARVYDTLNFQGKRLTIIPILKDEGKEGDRDFLQWDTISLMSLLGVYVIISYYKSAEKNSRFKHKITNQSFDIQHIKEEIHNLLSYQSDALHWNLSQAEKAGEIGQKALDAYQRISETLDVEMHSKETAKERINEITKGKEFFINVSRKLAKEAQNRESITIQPKERLTGTKATITIENYLGGYYYLTCDEAKIEEGKIYLIEGKHSNDKVIPSLNDIKDGLIKMILFTNLEEVKVGDVEYMPIPVLKLTTDVSLSISNLNKRQIHTLNNLINNLKKEADLNRFQVFINEKDIRELIKNYTNSNLLPDIEI